jgi:hypothetical protein
MRDYAATTCTGQAQSTVDQLNFPLRRSFLFANGRSQFRGKTKPGAGLDGSRLQYLL